MAYDYTKGSPINRTVSKFLNDYRAKARVVDVQTSYEPYSYSNFGINSPMPEYITTYRQNVMEITMAEEDMTRLIDNLQNIQDLERHYGPNITHFISQSQILANKDHREARIRSNNPGVQLAWEKYQMMLKIAGGE